MDYLLGIDIGTTNAKATLYDLNFEQIAVAGEEYPTVFPQRGWAEQDGDTWWSAAVVALRRITSSAGITGNSIKGICVSSQAPAVLPLDQDGRPLHNALIWMDRRSEPQCDRVHASLTGLYDIKALSWSKEISQILNLNLDLLPAIFNSTDVIGFVHSAAARETGLSEGIPVIAGNVDASSAALESGVIGRGEAAEMTGTSTCFMLGCDSWPDSINLVSIHHAVKGHDLLIGPISSTGASLKWYRDQIGCCVGDDRAAYEKDPYQYMDQLAANSPAAGKLIFLPYMAGERAPLWDTDARGVFFGLTHSTTRGQMIRAILEGSAFALKQIVTEADQSGQSIQSLSAVGGGSNSRVWLQIKANILGLPIKTLKHASRGAFGNALMAGFGVGLIPDIREVIDQKIHVREIFQPEPEQVRKYQKLFEIYRNIYEHTKADFSDLAFVE